MVRDRRMGSISGIAELEHDVDRCRGKTSLASPRRLSHIVHRVKGIDSISYR